MNGDDMDPPMNSSEGITDSRPTVVVEGRIGDVVVQPSPPMTRDGLLRELNLVYICASRVRPPRAVGGEITIGQQRNFQCKMDLLKTRIYALTSCYPVLRDAELHALEAEVAQIKEFLDAQDGYHD